jgi:hypothetical protein
LDLSHPSLSAALGALWTFPFCKLLILKELVGAKGFEPSTSWSRTRVAKILNALSGVAYGIQSLISPLLVVPNLYLNACWFGDVFEARAKIGAIWSFLQVVSVLASARVGQRVRQISREDYFGSMTLSPLI